MNISKKRGTSFTQFVLVIAFMIAGYLLILKPMILRTEVNNTKKTFINSYSRLDFATRKILESDVIGRFKTENSFLDALKENMAIDKSCDDSKKESCWSEKWLWDNDAVKPGMIFANGTMVVTDIIAPNCDDNSNIPNTCSVLYIDINGRNIPNKIGADILKVYFTQDGLKPAGSDEDVITPRSSCVLGQSYGWGCTAVYR